MKIWKERMHIRVRVRRRSFLQKHWLLSLIAASAVVGFLGFILWQNPPGPIAVHSSLPLKAERVPAPPPTPEFMPAKSSRAVYPYSVIPGGIRSRAELLDNIANDPVVASHYANFLIGETKFIRSQETVFVYVSYRLGNKVFWTGKTVKIPKGEPLVSDGTNLARTRCGNKISVLPQEPVSEEEPPIDSFDIPTFEPVMIASLEPPPLDLSPMPEPVLEPRPIAPLVPFVPLQTPVLGSLRSNSLRPLALYPSPQAIPEPGTIALMAGGLAALLLVKLSRKK